MRSFERIDVPLNQKMYKNQTGGATCKALKCLQAFEKEQPEISVAYFDMRWQKWE